MLSTELAEAVTRLQAAEEAHQSATGDAAARMQLLEQRETARAAHARAVRKVIDEGWSTGKFNKVTDLRRAIEVYVVGRIADGMCGM